MIEYSSASHLETVQLVIRLEWIILQSKALTTMVGLRITDRADHYPFFVGGISGCFVLFCASSFDAGENAKNIRRSKITVARDRTNPTMNPQTNVETCEL